MFNTPSSVAVVAIQSENHTITFTSKGTRYKLFKIQFHKNGDIFIHFPYYKYSNGVIGRVTLPPSVTTANLTDEARITSHRVKFSHHFDGNAHFSQDWKIRTTIRNKSIPLEELSGHLFTLSIQNITHFDQAKGEKYDHKSNLNKSVINIETDDEFEAIKFVATWEPFETFVDSLPKPILKESVGPKFIYKEGNGSYAFLLGPNPSNPLKGRVLFLRFSAIPKMVKTSDSALIFIGGFDSNIRVSNPNEDYHFLAMMYPYNLSKEDNAVMLESVDLQNSEKENQKNYS